ncbi:MAG: hypothetical protein ACRYGF_12590 [Janthinobacterium lividum]
MDEEDKFGDEVPLTRAVAVIWDHYESDKRRQVICSRLVAFYSLMVRSDGAILEPWIQSDADNPESVVLTSAIVEAVATARLSSNGQFVDSEFETLVGNLTERDSASYVAPALLPQFSNEVPPTTSAAHIPVTNIVKDLATHLFAFQACVASVPDADGSPQFRVLDKLCEHFAVMGGSHGLHSMLSRALLAHVSEFPWLRFARASPSGTVAGLTEIPQPPSPQEAARAELAVLGSLVELLRCFVGDVVTLQFLRTIWPLASFHSTPSTRSNA